MAEAVSNPTVVNFLFGSGIPYESIQVPDPAYMLPAKDWIAGEFASALQAELKRRAVFKYQLGKWDCTKFSRFAAEYANEAHAKTIGARDGTSLAFGEFWYKRDDGQGHAINFAVCRTPDLVLELVFFEPQSSQLVQLSKTEISQCDTARF